MLHLGACWTQRQKTLLAEPATAMSVPSAGPWVFSLFDFTPSTSGMRIHARATLALPVRMSMPRVFFLFFLNQLHTMLLHLQALSLFGCLLLACLHRSGPGFEMDNWAVRSLALASPPQVHCCLASGPAAWLVALPLHPPKALQGWLVARPWWWGVTHAGAARHR